MVKKSARKIMLIFAERNVFVPFPWKLVEDIFIQLKTFHFSIEKKGQINPIQRSAPPPCKSGSSEIFTSTVLQAERFCGFSLVRIFSLFFYI